MKFKIGDIIQPKKEHFENFKVFFTKFPFSGKVVGILGYDKKQFPVIKDTEGTSYTVNPDLYELVEHK